MSLFENIKSAFKNIISNKLRAMLTMLGIIIGISSVITITSIGAGSQAQMQESFDQMGVGRINVSVARGNRNISRADNLTMDDYELLKSNPDIKYIAATINSTLNIKLLDPKETKTASINGVSEQYYDIMSPTVLFGRYIDTNDVTTGAKVVVINDTTAQKVFGYCDEGVIGQKISVKTSRGTQKYSVIGILENKNAQMEAQYADQFPENVIIPITTLQRLLGVKEVSQMTIVVNDTDKIDQTAADITDALDKAHGTTEKYYVQNTMEMMEQVNSMLGMITMFISCVAGISLLVGGIGVMNIMLVTVTERTREIGIRKSIGARNSDIRTQFLIEALILTGFGGVLGLACGYGGGLLIQRFADLTPVVSPQAVILAISISSLIGIVFGVYPANKAAKLNPIEALRYE